MTTSQTMQHTPAGTAEFIAEIAAERDRLRSINAELLRCLQQWETAVQLGNVTFGNPIIQDRAISETRAAIAKAEGRS